MMTSNPLSRGPATDIHRYHREHRDLAEIIEVEVRKLMESLGLDFAIFRLMSPDDKPLMLCHGLDFKEAREHP